MLLSSLHLIVKLSFFLLIRDPFVSTVRSLLVQVLGTATTTTWFLSSAFWFEILWNCITNSSRNGCEYCFQLACKPILLPSLYDLSLVSDFHLGSCTLLFLLIWFPLYVRLGGFILVPLSVVRTNQAQVHGGIYEDAK